jgi:BlaI family transcriptional regulator, penicillinase repressor
MARNFQDLGDVQKEVMEIVWKLGEASVHDVIDHLDRGKKPAYTTILTVMQVLERKEWLTHRKEGRRGVHLQPRFIPRSGAEPDVASAPGRLVSRG